jgi:deoxyribonuclease-4
MGGIEYGPKGERNHLPIRESDFNYKDLLRTFKEFDIRGVAVAETPVLEQDTLLLKRAYARVKT